MHGTQMGYLIKYPYQLSCKPMLHLWDIIKNVHYALSVKTWDKVGIYQIVSLVWRGKTVCNKRWPYGDLVWDITKSVPIGKDGISQKV